MTMYYLKNKIDSGIIDVISSSLEKAKEKAAEILGGDACDYEERF